MLAGRRSVPSNTRSPTPESPDDSPHHARQGQKQDDERGDEGPGEQEAAEVKPGEFGKLEVGIREELMTLEQTAKSSCLLQRTHARKGR